MNSIDSYIKKISLKYNIPINELEKLWQSTSKNIDSCKKQELGQFFTTNYKYILQNFSIPEEETKIIEPFVGKGHLLQFINKSKYSIEIYDIDPHIISTIKRDTLKYPPCYKDKFILTNPPYLARNKSVSKTIFDKYNANDLYKCFIKQIISDPSNGGIIIIPLNFWCSVRKSDVDLRANFLKVYNVITINIFEEKVFEDTGYTICSFLFKLKREEPDPINVFIYPKYKHIKVELNLKNNYTFGGDIYSLPQSQTFTIERLTKDNIIRDTEYITNILVKCIDDNINNKICLKIIDEKQRYCDDSPKRSARSYATLIIKPKITNIQQNKLVSIFNEYLNTKRDKYHSLFLTNYRESNSIARKRISFSLVFEIVNYLLSVNKL